MTTFNWIFFVLLHVLIAFALFKRLQAVRETHKRKGELPFALLLLGLVLAIALALDYFFFWDKLVD